jgi:C4-dicarboxylate-specific signal transduction histidine kinase
VARPLREQLALTTLVLLIPVSAVMTWAAATTYREQIGQLEADARTLATAIAKHIELMEPEASFALTEYLAAIDVPDGTELTVAGRDGGIVAKHARRATSNVEERIHASVPVATRPWTVAVGIPTQVAWWRAEPIYRRTIAISGVATLILLAVEAVFIRRWLPALVHLERVADRVGAGDLSTPPTGPMPARELERLRDAFHDMIGRLRTAREDIARQVEEERRMREELESLQQQIIRQERLAAIGVLLSGIAHELNNPLQAISGFSEILQRNTSLAADVRADLALIQKESIRASAIIRNVSRFSRQQSTKPSTVYISDVIGSVVELRQRRLQEQSIALEIEDAATQPTLAIFTELQQVLLNFLINAEQSIVAAQPAVRRIVIRSRDEADRVRIEVEDTGPGVAPQDESKLFQPFFTTKPIGEGTGLGLSVSYGIVRSHGGTIGYARGAAGGAWFYFEIPAAEGPTPRG